MKTKKLSLSKETLKVLTNEEKSAVGGAVQYQDQPSDMDVTTLINCRCPLLGITVANCPPPTK